MSKIYITASIEMDTQILNENIEEIVKEKLKDGPEITGAEGNAEIYINKKNGYNYNEVIDCNGCIYEKTLRKGPADAGGGIICDAPEGYKCKMGDFQTEVILTINGELADRTRKETRSEYRKLINYLKRTRNGCGFEIIHKSCHIMELP